MGNNTDPTQLFSGIFLDRPAASPAFEGLYSGTVTGTSRLHKNGTTSSPGHVGIVYSTDLGTNTVTMIDAPYTG